MYIYIIFNSVLSYVALFLHLEPSYILIVMRVDVAYVTHERWGSQVWRFRSDETLFIVVLFRK